MTQIAFSHPRAVPLHNVGDRFPGNAGDIRVGFGLWEVEWASIAAEAALLLVGAFLYLVTALIVLSGAVVLALDVATA